MNGYILLQKRLNSYPYGYPEDEKSQEILKFLFTEEEAKVASVLPHLPITWDAKKIAKRVNMRIDKCIEILNSLDKKDLIYVNDRKPHQKKYSLIPMFPGVLEIQFIRTKNIQEREKKLASLLDESLSKKLGEEIYNYKTGMLRVVPIKSSISTSSKVFHYEEAREIIKRSGTICVMDCICRKSQKNCNKPLEVCFGFNKIAEHLIYKKYARKIDVDSALKILKKAEDAGLVHTSTNFKPPILAMCNCCACCCAFFKGVKIYNRPDTIVKSNFISKIKNNNDCILCGECVKICPISAVKMTKKNIYIDENKCIGCGLCVKFCEKNVLELQEKKERTPPPANLWHLTYYLSKERRKIKDVIISYLRDLF